LGIGNKLLSNHPDDGVRLVAQREGFSHNCRIASELALTKAVAQHRHFAAVGRVLLRGESVSQNHRGAEEAEVPLRNVKTMDLLEPVAGYVEAGATVIVCGDLLEDAGLAVKEMKLRNIVLVGSNYRGRRKKLDDTIRIGIAEGLEQHSVDYRKIAVFAPIPSANAATAAMVKPGFLKNIFIECLTSSLRVPTYRLPATVI
jgi:hypothetical protein